MDEVQSKLSEFLQKCSTCYEEGIKVIQDMQGWDQIEQEVDEVVCFQRPNPDTEFDTFKADLFLDFRPRLVSRYLYENWAELNATLNLQDFMQYEVVGRIGDDISVFHVKTQSKELVVPREFVLISVFLELGPSTFAITTTSIEVATLEPYPDTVRGEVKMTVHLFEPIAGNEERTHYQSTMLVDPKGQLPASLVNNVLGNRANFYRDLREKLIAEFGVSSSN